jgi:2,4-dienoyl-CoA reductase-like NADH-dependent reductase (Old Yellow Enzyme family)
MLLLRRIEREMKRRGISATRFGRICLRDPRLVFDIRRGRELTLRTERRIEAFLTQSEAGEVSWTR